MLNDKFARLEPRLLGKKPTDMDSAIKAVNELFLLSDSYREILLAFGGALWFDNGAKYKPKTPNPLTKKDGYNNLDMLYGLGDGKNSIVKKSAQYSGELPTTFVPIGEAPGGNLICVDSNGVVYLWDHESLPNEDTWRIANSVDELLEQLEPDDSEICNTDGIIESESFLDF